MRTYPKSTSNKNVPRGSFLIAENSATSGEVITTYYADREGKLFSVIDWKGCRPSPVYPFEVCRLTGDTPYIIKGRIDSYFRNLKP